MPARSDCSPSSPAQITHEGRPLPSHTNLRCCLQSTVYSVRYTLSSRNLSKPVQRDACGRVNADDAERVMIWRQGTRQHVAFRASSGARSAGRRVGLREMSLRKTWRQSWSGRPCGAVSAVVLCQGTYCRRSGPYRMKPPKIPSISPPKRFQNIFEARFDDFSGVLMAFRRMVLHEAKA